MVARVSLIPALASNQVSEALCSASLFLALLYGIAYIHTWLQLLYISYLFYQAGKRRQSLDLCVSSATIHVPPP